MKSPDNPTGSFIGYLEDDSNLINELLIALVEEKGKSPLLNALADDNHDRVFSIIIMNSCKVPLAYAARLIECVHVCICTAGLPE